MKTHQYMTNKIEKGHHLLKMDEPIYNACLGILKLMSVLKA